VVPVEAEKWMSSCKYWVKIRTKSSKFLSPFFWGPFMGPCILFIDHC
jgi:hypothetical protein